MKPRSKLETRNTETRPRQELPGQIIGELMAVIKNQFFPDVPVKEWGQNFTFLKREVVTWPAWWLNERGVTLPPARYKEILLAVFNEVKIHGNTGAVRHWPGYLKKCVQDHFKHHGEEYYEEGKAIRNLAERSLLAFTRATAPDSVENQVQALAEVHQALKSAHKPKQARPTAGSQLGLF